MQVGLPLRDDWNGRFQGTGGGGWVTGYGLPTIGAAVSQGYAGASTDGGHSATASASSWSLLSPGVVNYPLLQDFSAVALADMTQMGQQISFVATRDPAEYSWQIEVR